LTRNYPHGLDVNVLADDLQGDIDLIKDFRNDLIEMPDNALLVVEVGRAYRSVACFRYAMGETARAALDDLKESITYMSRAFGLGVVTDPYDFIQMIALAVVTGDAQATQFLAHAKRGDYTNEDVEVPAFVFAIAEGLAAAARSDMAALAKALAPYVAVPPKRLPRYDKLVYWPLLNLLVALNSGDSVAFAEAMQTRELEFVQFFARSDNKNDAEALIDIPGLAVLALARAAGLGAADVSVYRPLELLAN
jgi:hypothetical protein